MKLVLMIVILAGVTMFGNSFSKQMQQKLVFFKDLNHFCNILENQIAFHKDSLKTIVLKHQVSFSAVFQNVIVSFFVQKAPYQTVGLLTKSENQFLQNFLESLGKLDVNGELANVKNNKTEINRFVEEKTKNYNQMGPLGTKLGFLAGLLLCVILL